MKRTSAFISLILLCMIILSACASATPTSVASSDNNSSSSNSSANAAGSAKANLNTASGDDFMSAVPGLGNRMVREFMEYRPYVSIQQFRKEIGKYMDNAQVAE